MANGGAGGAAIRFEVRVRVVGAAAGEVRVRVRVRTCGLIWRRWDLTSE